mmetsp:Transcript_8084/g.23241  ORF Transcript_8084/g.23241 Transcript_8084/m.23241 type:complete len:290 (+) Transcript_8084:97-966(+)
MTVVLPRLNSIFIRPNMQFNSIQFNIRFDIKFNANPNSFGASSVPLSHHMSGCISSSRMLISRRFDWILLSIRPTSALASSTQDWISFSCCDTLPRALLTTPFNPFFFWSSSDAIVSSNTSSPNCSFRMSISRSISAISVFSFALVPASVMCFPTFLIFSSAVVSGSECAPFTSSTSKSFCLTSLRAWMPPMSSRARWNGSLICFCLPSNRVPAVIPSSLFLSLVSRLYSSTPNFFFRPTHSRSSSAISPRIFVLIAAFFAFFHRLAIACACAYKYVCACACACVRSFA